MILLAVFALLTWALSIETPYSVYIACTPAALCFVSNVTFLLSTTLESRINHADILYLRNYAKPSLVVHQFTRDIGALQLIVRGILRPPYDIVSFFPPAASPSDIQKDRRKFRKRGIHHVFTLRTRDDNAWKGAIEHFMVAARLVLVECFRNKGGFSWELSRLPELVDSNKIILISDEADCHYAAEIKNYLTKKYREMGSSRDLPIFIQDSTNEFRRRLIAKVRELAPYSDEFVQERSRPILLEIGLKILTILFTIAWWSSVLIALVAIAVLAAS